MTAFDYAVLAIVGASVLLGLWRGVVSELLALLAWIVAFLVAREYAGAVAPAFAGSISEPGMRLVAAYAAVFLTVLLLFSLARWLISRLLKAVGLAVLDRLLGACFGVMRGLLIVLIAVMLAGLTPLPRMVWWRDAVLAPPLETVVIAGKRWMPQELATRIKYR